MDVSGGGTPFFSASISKSWIKLKNTANYSRSFFVPALCFSLRCKFKATIVSYNLEQLS